MTLINRQKFTEQNIEGAYASHPQVEEARKAIDTTLNRFPIMLKNYNVVFDEGDTVFLFPISYLNRADRSLKTIVLEEIRKDWTSAGFQIKEEKAQLNDIYRCGFMALMFRLGK